MSHDVRGTLPALAVDLRRGMPMHIITLHLSLIATDAGFPLPPYGPVCDDQTLYRLCRRIPVPCFGYLPHVRDKSRHGLGCLIYSRHVDSLGHINGTAGRHLLHAGHDFAYDKLLIAGLTADSGPFVETVADWFLRHLGGRPAAITVQRVPGRTNAA